MCHNESKLNIFLKKVCYVKVKRRLNIVKLIEIANAEKCNKNK